MGKDSDGRNVGTPNYPVSFLHQRAVALLYDELTSRYRDENGKVPEVRVRLTPGGFWSHDLRAGVGAVKIPGEWDQVGGVVPDIILYADGEESGKPLRIIEVVVTNPPDVGKIKKLNTLQKRGVDVVVVRVNNSDDLQELCHQPHQFTFAAVTPQDYPSHANGQYHYRRHAEQDRIVRDFIAAVQICSPPLRRQLRDLLNEMDSLDALYPVRPKNPLREQLEA